ncbi:nascent polypeptide-associated complex subunit alpha, muscle-specific form [Cocos nucifera]|uniref:Nascent polypeptide-associated complex subunit alpha, muscle-specific form n=1 Tax=Cocos nucifera TaxID=13894 RepID=A0A8K0N4Z0_COCNU|nr:nascent polypeptide-associated complex subunit alpha, muscle-specific form [Cocos nucifera]
MSGMLHYFDFQHLLFTATSRTVPPELHHPTSQLEGVEAPRNSLELDEGKASSASVVSEEYDDVPVGIQVVPKPAAVTKRKKMITLFEEERRSSQAETPRTPGVVARLMGLDVLPDQLSCPATPCRKSPPLVESQEQCGKKNKKKKLKGECRRESVFPRQPLQSINCNVAGRYEVRSRSLPDTPRVSSARSWDSDPRLSLQLNKESTNKAMQEFGYFCELSGNYSLPPSPSPSMAKSRKKDFGRHQDENKSPRSHYYGREIVKQVKESIISRRGDGGDDIAVRSRRTKPAEKKAPCYVDTWSQRNSPTNNPSPSCSPPRIRFLEPSKSRPVEDQIPKSHQKPKFTRQRSPSPSLSSSNSFRSKDNVEAKAVKIGPTKCKKASYERFTERIKKQHPASETAGPDALSSPSQPASMLQKHLSEKKRSSIPSFVRMKRKEASPSPSRPVPEQIQQPFCSNQEQKLMNVGVEGALMPLKTPSCPQRLVPKEKDPEYRYVRSILELAGITGVAIPSFRWYSSSLPIDPIIFHQLELELPFFPTEEGQPQSKVEGEMILLGPTRHRWNRKLLFHLVEDILGDLLRWSHLTTPTIQQSHLIKHHDMDRRNKADGGELLLRELWRQMQSFPAADCQVVGDIDALVAADLPEAEIRRLVLHPLVVEETEDIAFEVAQEIFDDVLLEAAAFLGLVFRGA